MFERKRNNFSDTCFTGETEVLIPARYEIILAIIGQLEKFKPEYYRKIILYSAIPESKWNDEIKKIMINYSKIFDDLSFYDNRKLVSFKELANMGKSTYIYCVDSKNTVRLGKLTQSTLCKQDADVYEISLGHIANFYATNNQEVFLRNGAKKPVSEIKKGDIVRTFNVVENRFILNFSYLKKIETEVTGIEYHSTADVYNGKVDVYNNLFIYAKYEIDDIQEEIIDPISFNIVNVCSMLQ